MTLLQITPVRIIQIFLGFGAIAAFFILKEPLTISLIIGAILVIAGVYLSNTATFMKKEI